MTDNITVTFSKVENGYKLDKINGTDVGIDTPALNLQGNPTADFVAHNRVKIDSAVEKFKNSLLSQPMPIVKLPNMCPSENATLNIHEICGNGVVNKESFKRQAQIFHPDKNTGCDENQKQITTTNMALITNAKNECKSPISFLPKIVPEKQLAKEPLAIEPLALNSASISTGGMNFMNLFAQKSRRARSKHSNKTRRNKKTKKVS